MTKHLTLAAAVLVLSGCATPTHHITQWSTQRAADCTRVLLSTIPAERQPTYRNPLGVVCNHLWLTRHSRLTALYYQRCLFKEMESAVTYNQSAEQHIVNRLNYCEETKR